MKVPNIVIIKMTWQNIKDWDVFQYTIRCLLRHEKHIQT